MPEPWTLNFYQLVLTSMLNHLGTLDHSDLSGGRQMLIGLNSYSRYTFKLTFYGCIYRFFF